MKSVNDLMGNYVQELEKVICDFFEHPEKHNVLIAKIREIVLQLGMDIVTATFEEMDETLRISSQRRKNWTIVKKDKVSLVTTLGNITYNKTLFIDKNNKERAYLLDRLLGIEPHARMTTDVEEAIITEALKTTYNKAGESACMTNDYVSKETVMNKIHSLQFPETDFNKKSKKRSVSVLYIDADEAHIPLQYISRKGDIEKGKRNIAEPKLIYVYEGIDSQSTSSSKLIHPHYFGGIYEGTYEIERLWKRVYTYIENEYEADKIQTIYLNGDAAQWIKTGAEYLPNIVHVLDGYHLKKYAKQSVVYAKEEAEDYYTEILFAIRDKRKKYLIQLFDELISKIHEEDKELEEKKIEVIKISKRYLVGNFQAAHLRLSGGTCIIGSSTEAHVSHLYSCRMSMKPMGWSKLGVDKMSRLIIYYKNGGSITELIEYQKKDTKKIDQGKILSQYDVMRMEKGLKIGIKKNKYYDHLQVKVPDLIMKQMFWKGLV